MEKIKNSITQDNLMAEPTVNPTVNTVKKTHFVEHKTTYLAIAALGALGYSLYKFENKKEAALVVGVGILGISQGFSFSGSSNKFSDAAVYLAISVIPYAITRGAFQQKIQTSLLVSAALTSGLYFYSQNKINWSKKS
jgi:hypothetical protein